MYVSHLVNIEQVQVKEHWLQSNRRSTHSLLSLPPFV